MKTAYSRNYLPPAPVLPVALSSPGGAVQTDLLLALVDTGSDGTLVPVSLIDELDTPAFYRTGLRTLDGGSRRRVDVYLVDLIIQGMRLPSVEVVGDETGREIILGRNVLNKLLLLLDGPKQVTDLR